MEVFSEFFKPFQETVSAYLPRLIPALLILVAGVFFAFLAKFVFRGLIKSTLRMLEKRMAHYRLLVSPGREVILVGVIPRLVYWFIVVLSLAIASEALGLPLFSTWLTQLIIYVPHVMLAILIVIAGLMAGSFFRDIIIKSAFRLRIPHGDVLGRVIQVITVVVSSVVAVNELGIDVSFLTTIISVILAAFLLAAAIAFGMGANTSIRNILACYYARKSMEAGQRVKIGEMTGTVAEITATTVVLDTQEGQLMIPGHVFAEKMTLVVRSKQKQS
jgi:small-conductance mechanosensitive channel